MRSLPRWVLPTALVVCLLALITYVGTKAMEKAALPTIGSLSLQVRSRDGKTVVLSGIYSYANSTMNIHPNVSVAISNPGGMRLAPTRGGESGACTVSERQILCPIPSRMKGKHQNFSVVLTSSSPVDQCIRFEAVATTGEVAEDQLNCRKK